MNDHNKKLYEQAKKNLELYRSNKVKPKSKFDLMYYWLAIELRIFQLITWYRLKRDKYNEKRLEAYLKMEQVMKEYNKLLEELKNGRFN